MRACELATTLADVRYKEHAFMVRADGERMYLQVEWDGLDSETKEPMRVRGRKWFLSPHMTKSEIVQTALAAILAIEEHEAREAFQYKGKAIFGPHYDVEQLHALCSKERALDER